MATLTNEQIADLRADIGDDGTVFSVTELDRNFTRAGGNYEQTVVICLRQIRAQATKLHNYTIAQSSHSLQQVHDNIVELLAYWEDVVQTKASGGQVKILGLRAVPPRAKDGPVV